MNGTKRSWDDMDSLNAAVFGCQDNNSTDTGGAKLDDNASAASRQKSCNACVRGKRRCDKQTPRCGRCSAKGLDCVYQKLPPGASSAADSASFSAASSAAQSAEPCLAAEAASASASAPPPVGDTSATALPALSSSSTASSSSCLSDFDIGFDLDSLGPGTGPGTNDTSPQSFNADTGALDFSIVDFFAAQPSSSTTTAVGEQDPWGFHAFTADKLSVPPLPTGLMAPAPMQSRQPIRDLSLIKAVQTNCMDVDPLTVHDPTTRVGFSVAFMSKFPATFAQTRALPFMHHRLWTGQLPKAILAVFSASTAYANCNPSNKAWTIRLLVDAAREIHREGERAVSNAEKLSRVQALLILNTMRIFDGDIGLRAAAERELPIFKTWLKELACMLNDLEIEEGYRNSTGFQREKMPRTWESWTFLESTRRTLIASFATICLSSLLKSELSDETLWEGDCAFTASRHLWEAGSSVEFYRAWREKPQFRITNWVFHDFWVYARPDDCDDFTRLMLTSQVGCDTMEHFMNGDVSIPVDPLRAC